MLICIASSKTHVDVLDTEDFVIERIPSEDIAKACKSGIIVEGVTLRGDDIVAFPIYNILKFLER